FCPARLIPFPCLCLSAWLSTSISHRLVIWPCSKTSALSAPPPCSAESWWMAQPRAQTPQAPRRHFRSTKLPRVALLPAPTTGPDATRYLAIAELDRAARRHRPATQRERPLSLPRDCGWPVRDCDCPALRRQARCASLHRAWLMPPGTPWSCANPISSHQPPSASRPIALPKVPNAKRRAPSSSEAGNRNSAAE